MVEKDSAYVLYGREDLRCEVLPLPDLKENEVLVELQTMGICGSDIHYFQHGRVGSFVPTRPFILGHEAAGTVIDAGSAVTVLCPGARVAINPSHPCRICEFCQAGKSNLCPNMRYFGSAAVDPPVDGVFRKYLVLAESNCLELPPQVDFGMGALLEPLSVAIHAVKRAGMIYGASVLVMGGGAIGQLILQVARKFGVGRLVLSDIDAWRQNFALLNGADAAYDPREGSMDQCVGMPSGGYDLIIEASGAEAALQAAIQLAHRGGTIVQVGTLPAQSTLPANLIMNKELALLGSFRFADEMKTALNLLATDSNDFSALITHTLPFDQFIQAIKLASGRGQTIKVQVTP